MSLDIGIDIYLDLYLDVYLDPGLVSLVFILDTMFIVSHHCLLVSLVVGSYYIGIRGIVKRRVDKCIREHQDYGI